MSKQGEEEENKNQGKTDTGIRIMMKCHNTIIIWLIMGRNLIWFRERSWEGESIRACE